MTNGRRLALAVLAMASLLLPQRDPSAVQPVRRDASTSLPVAMDAVAAESPPLAADPVETPSFPYEPQPEPTPDLAAEVASLRAEITALRRELAVRLAAESNPPRGVIAAPTAEADTAPSRDPNVRTIAIAAVFLTIGWLLGSILGRRRSRAQRNRLRF